MANFPSTGEDEVIVRRALSNASFTALVCIAACGESHPIPTDAGPRLDSAPTTGTVDPMRFCEELSRVECFRRRQREEIDDPGRDACIADVPARCAGFSFTFGCEPTSAQADACIAALRNLGNLNVPLSAIPECNFCP
jgi:hypothetical protein